MFYDVIADRRKYKMDTVWILVILAPNIFVT